MQALHRPQGMIVVTGPTGSGKTVTLYSALHQLNRLEVNILTAEDPIEITLPGINQVAINPKIGLTFAKALRAFLRQDPDIIMVGEIRDQETADMAVKAAHTGHLVLSTLHTNSALDTLDRLLHLGLPPVHLASALSLIIAQRLARKLCEHCKIPVEGSSLYQAQGCKHCLSGYKGRVGLFEVLPISQALQHLIRTSAPLPALLALAKEEGMQTLWESGMQQVKAGITTVEEVKRVTLD
jgi:type IV pilus assembly protein PilB